jgi:hypothetical protein
MPKSVPQRFPAGWRLRAPTGPSSILESDAAKARAVFEYRTAAYYSVALADSLSASSGWFRAARPPLGRSPIPGK